MGSKITKAIYKNQRQKPVSMQATVQAVKVMSLTLYSLATIFLGYVFDIDLILEQQLKTYYGIQVSSLFPLIQNILIILFLLILSALASAYSHRFIQIKCSFICIISHIILYFSAKHSSLTLMIIGQILLELSNAGLIICTLAYINQHFNIKKQSVFVFIAFFAIHEIGIRISVELTPHIEQNSLVSVYLIAMLMSFLQLLCIGLIFILEKVYMTPKEKKKINIQKQFNKINILQHIVSQLKQHKQYFPHFIITFINQFLINRLYNISPDDNIYNTLKLLILTLFLLSIFLISKFLKLKSLLPIIQTIGILLSLSLFFSQTNNCQVIIIFSAFNFYMISVLSSTNSFFTFISGIMLICTYIAHTFKNTNNTINTILIIITFQISVFIYYKNTKNIRFNI